MGFPSILSRIAISRNLLSSKPTNPSILLSSRWFSNLVANNINKAESSLPSSSAAYHVSSGGYMRGTVFWEPDTPLTIEEFHMPRPKAGEVLIKTKACGVCHSDLHVIKGEIPFSSPCVIGHEVTGEIVEHGPLTDRKIIERFPIGSQVVGAFIMPCGNCFFCSKGHDDLCEDFFAYNRAKGTLYDGETRLFLRNSGKPVYMYSMGGLAEYCVIPAHGLAILPKSLPYTESAILGCAVFTAYGAMRHAAEVCPGDSIAVIGVGGVGSRSPSQGNKMRIGSNNGFLISCNKGILDQSCLQIARAFGASLVIAVDIQNDKLQKAKTLGATHTVNAIEEDAIERIKAFIACFDKEITGGPGVDIAVEALGKPQTFLQCLQSVRDGGKAVMIGLSKAGAIGEVDINRLVRRKIRVIGSYGARARQDLPKLVKLAETGIFNLNNAVSRKYKFEEGNKAFQDLNQGRIVSRGVIEIM
ncbi:hypothetical protein CXB51_026297 [Gossypium anomalum]|uniref:Enoyl reductase (ER) domain-containing protein n=1 Tax=Gossypium anomalum TaxID=47600 RepID=A0A8J5YDZ0_9ROSI|nr:hypothetical protein CXB51_026297 [Gossypium anomalum]